jgi:hypothetical protein
MEKRLVLVLGGLTMLFGGMLIIDSMEAFSQPLTIEGINSAIAASNTDSGVKFTDSFNLENCTFSSTGSNLYFILKPGYRLVYMGTDEGKDVNLTATVLNKTKVVGGIETRILEERAANSKTGELYEVSRNYFAICNETNSAFYFGEDVDWYKNGNIVNHTGTWHHGINNAKAGLIMPGIVLLGSRYHQETAPDVAIDRAELISMSETVETPAGKFVNCLQEKDTDALDPEEVADRFYAPGKGQIKDDMLSLVSYGYIK